MVKGTLSTSQTTLAQLPYNCASELISFLLVYFQTGDYVAKCVNNFLDSFGIYDRKTILGVSSTFPMKQETLQDGTIVNWNNEFADNENSGDFFTQLKVSLKKYKVGSTRGYEVRGTRHY